MDTQSIGNGTSTSSLRILILAPAQISPVAISTSTSTPQRNPFPRFLERLTGSTTHDITSFSGYTNHAPIHIKTKYYEKNVNIWCDELPVPAPNTSSPQARANEAGPNVSLQEWQDQMISASAREVRDVIGAIILLLPSKGTDQVQWTQYIESVSVLRDLIEDETSREVAGLVILDFAKDSTAAVSKLVDQFENECLSQRGILGWDFIGLNDEAGSLDRNEFGEKTGFDRVVEVLQGVDWSAAAGDSDQDENGMDMSFLDDINLSSLGHDFPLDKEIDSHGDEEQRELMELKMAMLGVDDTRAQEKDDEFGELISAHLPSQSERKDDDVWAALDDRDIQNEALQVNQFQGLMERVASIREAGSEMSRAEREKFARREISRLMKEL